MKKLLLFAMVAMLLMPFSAKAQVDADQLPSGYCTVNTKQPDWASSYTHAVQSFTVTVNGEEVMNVPSVTSTFNNLTSTVFEAEQGSEIIVKIVNGTWTNNVWLGFDWDRDGAFDDVYQAYEANREGGTNDEYSFEVTVPADAELGKSMVRLYSDGVVDEDLWDITSPMCGTHGAGKIGYCGSVHNFTINVLQGVTSDVKYNVTVASADEAMGTAEVSATEVYENSRVTLTATANSGYKFSAWTVNGEVVSTANPYSAKITADTEFVANFAPLANITVGASANNPEMGEAISSAEGEVLEGTEITLMATAKEGYEFVNWTVNDEVVSEEATFTTTVNVATVFIANFKVKSNTIDPISAEISMTAWDSYTADKIIDKNPSSRYESLYNQENGATITVSFDDEYVIEKVAINFGYVSNIPLESKLQVSKDGTTWTDIEDSSFTATDADGAVVTVDCKGVTGKAVRMVLVSRASAYLVIYEFEVYGKALDVPARSVSVSVNDETMGTAYIGTEGTTSVEDTTAPVKLYAVANEGYEFVNWTVDGVEVSTDATYTDKTEGNKAYVANFVALAQCTVSVSVNDATMGSATASQTGEMFKYTEVTFEATANEGYEFVNWTVGDNVVSKSATFTAVIEESTEYKANFRVPPTKLALESVFASFELASLPNIIDGRMSSESFKKLDANGETVTVVLENESAIGDIALYFYNSESFQPSKAKIQVSSDNETYTDLEGCSFIQSDLEGGVIVLDAKGVSAKYVRLVLEETTWFDMWEFEVYEAPVNVAPRQISVSVNDASMGTAYVGTESITSVSNQTGAVRIVATATENAYRFVNWTVNGEEVATTAAFVDRTEGDKAYVANFEAKPIYTATATSANTERGTVELTASEVIYEGDEVTFTATPADGYKFLAWTSGTDTISVANPYTVTMTESLSLVANFDRDPKLDRSNWTIIASSEETSGEGAGNGIATCIIDGEEDTFWHSAWKDSSPAYPHWFMIDMQESKAFDSFEYVSRGATSSSEDSYSNGNIVNYALYTSDEPIDAAALDQATLVKEGQFTYDGVNKVHKVEFNSVKGRYVMLYATGQSANGGKHASCVEFYLYSNAFAVAVASADEAMGTAYIGEEGVTSVGCSVEGTDVVTLTAVPADKYQFVNWTLNGEVVSTDAVYTTTEVTESRSYVANFEFAPVAPRTITATVNNSAKGSVVFLSPESTETSVVSDNIVVVKAVPATTDDFFVNWTINGEVVGTEETYEYLDAEAATIQANFESRYVVTINQVTGGIISVKANGNTITNGDRVLEGSSLTLSVTENNRSELKKLFVNGEDVFLQYKYNADFAVSVTGSVTITAEYGDPVCIVTWENIGNGYVEVWEYDNFDADADDAGEMEYPLQPDGEQYAWGTEIPFLGTAAIFAFPMGDDVLESLTINGEEIDLDELWYPYEDYFIEEVESKLHIVATFSGEGTGIEDAEADAASVYAVAGGIVVETAEAANVSIYSIAGVLVSEQTVSAKTTIAMEQGVYIVKVADKVAKVVVK